MLELTQKATKSTVASARKHGRTGAGARTSAPGACMLARACAALCWRPMVLRYSGRTVKGSIHGAPGTRLAQGLSRVLTPGLEGTVSDTHGDVLQFIHVGEEFSSSPSIVLRDSLKDQARNFFGLFHKDRVRELSRHKCQPMLVHSRARRQAAISEEPQQHGTKPHPAQAVATPTVRRGAAHFRCHALRAAGQHTVSCRCSGLERAQRAMLWRLFVCSQIDLTSQMLTTESWTQVPVAQGWSVEHIQELAPFTNAVRSPQALPGSPRSRAQMHVQLTPTAFARTLALGMLSRP